MKKSYMVFGLKLIAYRTPNNLYAIRQFDSEYEAEDWVKTEMLTYGTVRSFENGKLGHTFDDVIIIPHYEKIER